MNSLNALLAQSPVSFLWPQLLWLLLILPLLVLLYWWLLRRRRQTALRFASLSIVREAMGKGPGWRRHVPPVLLLFAFAAMLLASARPMATILLPSTQQTIILAMDVSGSMRATDVLPNRLVASQNAAKAFLKELPRHVKVGIVAFAGTAQVVQSPTLSREDLVVAIDKFQLQRATAIGSAIVVALGELFPGQGLDLASLTYGRHSDPFAPQGRSLDQALAARDRCMTELLYGSGLRIAELLDLDVRASTQSRGWLDLQLAELWSFRELLYFLIRHKQSGVLVRMLLMHHQICLERRLQAMGVTSQR